MPILPIPRQWAALPLSRPLVILCRSDSVPSAPVHTANLTPALGRLCRFFNRVLAHYPPSPPAGGQYSCIGGRCILSNHAGGGPLPNCSGACAPLAAHEWLAVRRLSQLGDDNRTLIVSLPAGQVGQGWKVMVARSLRTVHMATTVLLSPLVTLPPKRAATVYYWERRHNWIKCW